MRASGNILERGDNEGWHDRTATEKVEAEGEVDMPESEQFVCASQGAESDASNAFVKDRWLITINIIMRNKLTSTSQGLH